MVKIGDFTYKVGKLVKIRFHDFRLNERTFEVRATPLPLPRIVSRVDPIKC